MEQSVSEIGDPRVEKILRDIFGFSALRGLQAPAIASALNGRSSIVIMPTGGGKSLCYQLVARALNEQQPSLTVVVSPLIALMKDQVDAAVKRGLRCCFINSSLSGDERESRYRALARGRFEIVYVTPERFRNSASCLHFGRMTKIAYPARWCACLTKVGLYVGHATTLTRLGICQHLV